MRLPLVAVLLALAAPAHAATSFELGDGTPSAKLKGPGFTVTATMEKRDVEGEPADVPVFRIVEGGKTVFELEGAAAGFEFPQGGAEVVEVDAANDGPEVAFTSYTGGAHCCTAVVIADRDADGDWRTVDLDLWDGGGEFKDLDGDGEKEFVSRDNTFLYAFDCYACSVAPMTVRSIDDGEVSDASADPRFVKAHRAWLADIEADAPSGEDRGKGWWAGWIAAKARVGEGREAWDLFQTDYVPAPDDEGVLVCAVDQDPCPDDKWTNAPFPPELEKFLRKAGFEIE